MSYPEILDGTLSLFVIYLFICLLIAAPGLSWVTQGLQSSLQHSGSLTVAWELLVASFRLFLFPDQGLNPGPLALGAQSLTHWTTRSSLVAGSEQFSSVSQVVTPVSLVPSPAPQPTQLSPKANMELCRHSQGECVE